MGVRRAFSQGDLDSLCGVYSLVNAACYLDPTIDKEAGQKLFSELVATLFSYFKRKNRKPGCDSIAFIWEGLKFCDLDPALKCLRQFLTEDRGLEVQIKRIKFAGNKANIASAWKKLQVTMQPENGLRKVLVVGYNWRGENGETGHWTCVKEVTDNTLVLLDSLNRRKLRRKELKLGALQSGKFSLDKTVRLLTARRVREPAL